MPRRTAKPAEATESERLALLFGDAPYEVRLKALKTITEPKRLRALGLILVAVVGVATNADKVANWILRFLP